MGGFEKNRFFIRLKHWEYYPFFIVYFPIFFYWLWLSCKARSFFFFNTVNPTIENGGYLMESKYSIYRLIPENYYPKTIFISAETPLQQIKEILSNENFDYPFIAKPDIGMKGKGVQKIDSINQLEKYITRNKVDFLIQEYIDYENEAGIFYCRLPGNERGFISGIVLKELMTVTGDGSSSIRQLIEKNERSFLQINDLLKEYGKELNTVLPKGETKILMPYGNHARGAKFIDGSHLINKDLEAAIDNVCKQINGFYFGRLDIRYPSWNELKKGNFSIIELNGAGSEPTHIYDPKHSILFAWKEITRHLKILYRIGKINHQQLNLPYTSFNEGIKLFRNHFRYQRRLKESSAL